MSKTIDKRIQRSKKALINALIELMSENDPLSISISDIVNQAGYSRATFYAHYGSKEEFFSDIIYSEAQTHANILFETAVDLKEDTDYLQVASAGVLRLFRHVYQRKELYEIILSDRLYGYTTDYFCELIVKAISENYEYTLIDDIENYEMYSYTSTAFQLATIKYWMKDHFKFSPEYMERETRFLIYGTANTLRTIRKKRKS